MWLTVKYQHRANKSLLYCFKFLKISKNILNKLHGTRTGTVELSYFCPPETRITSHRKLHRTRTVPAHDFYMQTSNNV